MIHIWRPWKWPNVKNPHPLVHLRPKFFRSLDLARPISNELPPSPNDNQSIKRKHNPSMNIICYQVLPLPSRRLFFDFFSLSWSLTICFILLCVQLPQNITKCLSFIIIHIFSTHFAITWFICTKPKQKQSQLTSHSNWPRSIVRFNPLTVQWYH